MAGAPRFLQSVLSRIHRTAQKSYESTTPHTGVARRRCDSHLRGGGMVVDADPSSGAANRNCRIRSPGLSVGRGENPTQTNQAPLELHRSAKHLVLDLPIGSREGPYEVALLSETGVQVLVTRGNAQLQDHIVVLRAEVDVGGVRRVYTTSCSATRFGMDALSRPRVLTRVTHIFGFGSSRRRK